MRGLTALLAWLLGLMMPGAPPARSRPGANERWAAKHADRLAKKRGEGMAATLEYFADMVPGRPVSRLREFVTRWSKRPATEVGMQPRSSTGRPPKISNRLVYTIATEWTLKGVGTGVFHRPYRSMEEVRGRGAPRLPRQQAGGAPAPACTARSTSHTALRCAAVKSCRQWQSTLS